MVCVGVRHWAWKRLMVKSIFFDAFAKKYDSILRATVFVRAQAIFTGKSNTSTQAN
jgi:hypothetical protein